MNPLVRGGRKFNPYGSTARSRSMFRVALAIAASQERGLIVIGSLVTLLASPEAKPTVLRP